MACLIQMRHIDVTLTSRRRKFYCATDANSDAESSIHEKRYQQCSLFILSSMLRIFSPPGGRARIREIAERRSCKHVFPNTRIYSQRYTHVSTPTRHIFDFRMLSVCTRIRIRTTVPLSAPYSPRTNISRVYHSSASESDRYTERKRGGGKKTERGGKRERERKREGMNNDRESESERD